MEQKNSFPKRRFEGFTNDWELRKLGELAEVKDSARISNKLWEEKGIPYLRSSDLANEKLQGELFISKETYEGFVLKTGAPQKGDVLFTSGGKVGVVYHKEDESPVYVQGGAILYIKTSTSKLLDGSFMSIYFMSPRMQKYMDVASSGGTIKHFTLKPANASPIKFPYLIEQQKIGKFFKILDERIANQERMIAKVKALKSAYLTEMLPQEGETLPKRRFEGFEEKWVRRRVGDIFQVTRGNVLSTTKIEKKQSKISHYPVYSSQTQNNGLLGYYSDYLFDTAITWTTDGANAGTVNYREGKFYSTNVNGVLISKEGYACKAVAEILDLKAWKHVSKIGNPKLMNNVMSNIEILISNNIKELEMLSLFFTNLDDQIKTEEKKLEKLKKMKEAYLEEMFV
ncbi:restriction endonuclease subunit S [Terribacillus aidingensis]|uniref:restriction endonuclease subunit S n=1 Tax=Terribacillus aidingensis TaxID=586416 RepID=UPI00344F0E77